LSNKRPKILLAEDDQNLGRLLTDYLQAEGLDICLCKDGEQALQLFRDNRFDLCLLDIMMPRLDGFTLARQIRELDQNVPLIFISARSLKEDKLRGYGLNADDYITKPFDEEELLWKIRAVIRRVSEPVKGLPQMVKIGQYCFDFENRSLVMNENFKRVTEKEAEILRYLSDHRNQVIRRDAMVKSIWGESSYFFGRSLDVFITKIRRYLKDDISISIENVFKVGFIFKVPSD
jgi:DNA-binding response OmpR family regulator